MRAIEKKVECNRKEKRRKRLNAIEEKIECNRKEKRTKRLNAIEEKVECNRKDKKKKEKIRREGKRNVEFLRDREF